MRFMVGPSISSLRQYRLFGRPFQMVNSLTGSRFRLPGYQTSQTLSLNEGTAAFANAVLENNYKASYYRIRAVFCRIRWRCLPGSDAFSSIKCQWSNSMASTDRRFVFKVELLVGHDLVIESPSNKSLRPT